MWISLHSQFENGLSYLKFQRIGFIIATVFLPLLVILTTYNNKEWYFIVLANIISLIPLCIMQPFTLNKIISKGSVLKSKKMDIATIN